MRPVVQTEGKSTKLHYGWVLVVTGVAVLFSCIGLGRFSLGMLLPSMGASLGLTYSQMGFISTGNLIGYLTGVVLATIVAKRAGARRTIVLGLFLVGGSMALIGFSATFHEVLFLYIATGVGSSLANVPMIGLVAHWFLKSFRGRAAGTILTGNALAIVFAGIFIPHLNTGFGAEGWRIGWLAMGAVSLAVTVIAAIFLRNNPAEKGLLPLGATNGSSGQGSDPEPIHERKSYRGAMVHLGLIFALFGATQVVYATFIVTVMVTERGFGETAAGTFWSVVGAFSIFSGHLFGWLSDKLGRRAGMMIVNVLFTVSFALAAADLPNAYLFISIAVFGLSMWSIPTIMYAAVGDYMEPARAAAAIGFITLFCGAGQIIGPAAAGILADKAGTFQIVFWLCAVLSASAVPISFFLRSPEN
jgi:MFS family permease